MSAIHSTLKLVAAKLDASLQVSDPRTEPWVILSNVVDHEGRLLEPTKDKIVVSLAGLQHETIVSTFNRTTPVGGDQYGAVLPPLYVNLLVAFFANFSGDNYPTGLTMLARTLAFFQRSPSFTPDTLPDLDPTIDKLSFEMMNLDMMQASYLMGMMGVKYLPTVVYRVRLIPFKSDAVTGIVPPARSASTAEAPDPS